MREICRFVLKGIIRSKYIHIMLILILLSVSFWMFLNSKEASGTQTKLQETFEDRLEFVDFLIGKTLNKKRHVGLLENQQLALDSLLVQEEYLKGISKKIADDNLDIAPATLSYIKEYQEYSTFNFIGYQSDKQLEVELKKAETLIRYDLPYTEEEKPFKTALFSKQLFQFLFNPITAFLFLLIFSYKYVADKQNRIFDFLKIHSLSNTTIYYGYLFPFLLIILGYITVASAFSLLPAFLTGNIDTIHYPIEVINGAETILVPVWKWLLYLPIAWGIFVSLLAVLALCLFKIRFPLGAVFGAVGLSLTVAYIVQAQFGFFMWNPIHLIVSYESSLLTAQGFIFFLLGMFVLLLIFLAVSYPIFKSRRLALNTQASSSTKKQYQPKGKLKLLQFEHIKKKRKGHLLFSLILLIGIMGGNFIIVNQQYEKLPVTYLKVIEDLQNILIEQQMHWKVLSDEFDTEREIRLQESDEEETELEEENPYVEMIEGYVYEYNVLEGLKKDIHSPDFSDTYRETMNRLNTYSSYKELDRSFWTVTVMASEEQRHILEEKGIKPWPIGDQWISHFQDPSVATDFDRYKLLKASQERNTKYDNSSLFTFYKLFDWNVLWLAFGGFILLLWTSLSEEQRPTPSIHFLRTNPILLRSIYLNKWVYNMLIAYGLLLISSGSIFLISSLIGGTGESQYPILVYANSGNDNSFTLTLQTSEGGEGGNSSDGMFYSNQDNVDFSFESLLVLILKSGILVMGQIFFLNGLFTLVGRWLKNHYATIIITLLVSFLGYFVANQYIATPFMYVNPFVYFDTWNIVDGWKSIVASSTQVNFINGCISLFATGLLLFIVGWVSGRKRRMSS